MGKGGGSVTIGYRYFMTMHMGVSRGPIDEIIEIRVGDKQAWPKPAGTTATPPVSVINDDGVFQIKADKLFGGDKAEGGVSGTLTVCMGKPTQIFPAWVKAKMGGLVPDFRGVCTLVFDGLIASLNPYPKSWAIRARRALKGWDGAVWHPELALIPLTSGKIKAMNPAHILYECATNRDWGRGLPRTRINDARWLSAAQTLFNEDFGLCIRWNRQDTLQTFVQNVLSHIGGSIYTDRETGLLTLDLIRDDYDPNDLPLFDYNSGLLGIEDGEVVSRDGAVNEVIVKYHDPIENVDREVRAQNLASIQTLGATNSSTIDYAGIPTSSLGARVAQRDLRTSATTLRRFKVRLDRRAWRVYPGAVFRVSAPDKGIGNLVLRAGKVSQSSITNGEITVDAVVDIFGLPSSAFVETPDNEWVPPDSTPAPAVNRYMREATWFDLVGRLRPADLALVDPTSGTIATLGTRPTPLAQGYGVATRIGSANFVQRATGSWAPAVRLSAAIGPYDTTIAFTESFDLGLFEADTLLQLGDEIVFITDVVGDPDGVSGTISIARGCVDTIPAPHAAGTWAYSLDDTLGTDGREYAISEIVDIKLLTMTSSGSLDPTLAPINSLTIAGRQGKPYPPAAVQVNGNPCFGVTSVSGAISVQWNHRDRILQQDRIITHFDASMGPEAGTTYNVRIYSGSTLLGSFLGITDNYWIYTGSSFTGNIRIELESERDTFKSFQKYSFSLTRTP